MIALFYLFAYIVQTSTHQCKEGIEVLTLGMSDADRMEVLYAHNHLRQQVALGLVEGLPPACDMRKMTYDMALEKAATQMAATCIYEHVTKEDERFGALGQNLYTEFGPKLEPTKVWDKAIHAWFSEMSLYTYPDKYSYEYGHFTQIMWADSQCLGCSWVYFRGNQDNKIVYCHYGPGQLQSTAPYNTECENPCEGLCPPEEGLCFGIPTVSNSTSRVEYAYGGTRDYVEEPYAYGGTRDYVEEPYAYGGTRDYVENVEEPYVYGGTRDYVENVEEPYVYGGTRGYVQNVEEPIYYLYT